MKSPLSPLPLCALLLAGWAGSPLVIAQPAAAKPPTALAKPADAGGPAWGSLSAPQRQALAPLERDWAGIDASRKAKWLEVAARFPAMPADERQRVQARMAEWARLTPAERGRARLSFQETKQFSREEKQQRWEAYQALPDDQRRALADKARPAEDRPRPSTVPATPLNLEQPKRASPATAAASAARMKPVAPTIVQAKPGATTTLMTSPATPPAHQRPGEPKIAAKPSQVDGSTLLPKSGPQAAASAPRRP